MLLLLSVIVIYTVILLFIVIVLISNFITTVKFHNYGDASKRPWALLKCEAF